MNKILLLFALSALFTGCAAEQTWQKPGGSVSDFNIDKGQCQAQAFSVAGPMMQQAMVYNSCMRGKGWELQ